MKAAHVIRWRKQPKQIEFLRACGLSYAIEGGQSGQPVARIIFYGGAAGGGKSDALVIAGGIAATGFPGCSVGFFRREYPMLEGPGGAILRSHELFGGLAKWNGSLRRWTFPNKSIFQFCHAKTESDVYSYQSQQFDVLLIDESTQFTRFQIRYLLTRNRATVSGIIPFCAMASNPGNVSHGYHKQEFINAGPPGVPVDVEVEPGRYEKHIFIPSRLEDNQVLERRDPGYRNTLENQAEDIRRALLEGDWDVFAGQYFKEFRVAKHVIEPVTIPDYWRRFRSIDWGYNDPCCVLWHAVDTEGKVYTYRELYINQTLASDVAKKIVELSEGEQIDYTAASPDMWQKRGQMNYLQGECIADDFQKAGVLLVRADNDRLNGWNRIREYLKDAPDGKPYWQCFKTCFNLIRTLPELIYDEHRVEDVSDACEDHAPESLRYGLMSRPRISVIPKKPLTGDAKRIHDHIESLVKRQKGSKLRRHMVGRIGT